MGDVSMMIIMLAHGCSMKKDAEEKKLPPIYRGKWAAASKEEVEAMKASGAPYCYRFRVPKVDLCVEGGGGGRVHVAGKGVVCI
jgi:glutamyl/glutaminyl-tRNA synthetase